jgi:hypothetical protein
MIYHIIDLLLMGQEDASALLPGPVRPSMGAWDLGSDTVGARGFAVAADLIGSSLVISFLGATVL